jgi:murein DD-endopeptidase MepM/ murein hydrolase activator NlpD
MTHAKLAVVLSAGVLLCALVMGIGQSPVAARPVSADLLPSPLPSLLPSLPPPPPPPPPPPLVPVPSAVSQVVSPAALPVQPLHPSQSGQPASAAGSGGAGAGTGGSSSSPPYQPSPAEQAALPPEPERVAMEGQQAWLASSSAALDQQDGAQAQEVGGGTGRFIWPITFSGPPPITQRFGCTNVAGEPYSPDCATHRFHTGIDLADHTGAPVYAADAGVAHVFPGTMGYGNYVLVVHGSGWSTLYAHLSAFTVHDGDAVRRGDPIGLVGSTGFSTGPHLHFETRYADHPQDPCLLLGC